jgi:nicotinate-nucleotide adenylyltransferase
MGGRAGVLTGTFDPIHLGHIALAEGAISQFDLDFVLIWVNAGAEHKSGVTAFGDRLAMARLAVAGHDRLRVYEGHAVLRPHVMSSFSSLERDYHGTQLVYLLGADTFATIDRWDELESVVKQATFGVARRPGAGTDAISQMRARLGELGEDLKAQTFDLAGHTQASSRKIREDIRAGRQPESLDPKVYDYIKAHNLYR